MGNVHIVIRNTQTYHLLNTMFASSILKPTTRYVAIYVRKILAQNWLWGSICLLAITSNTSEQWSKMVTGVFYEILYWSKHYYSYFDTKYKHDITVLWFCLISTKTLFRYSSGIIYSGDNCFVIVVVIHRW